MIPIAPPTNLAGPSDIAGKLASKFNASQGPATKAMMINKDPQKMVRNINMAQIYQVYWQNASIMSLFQTMGIITKRGDCGLTETLGGEEISKSDIRLHCIGTLDELNSAIGLARSLANEKGLKEVGRELRSIQLALFHLGSEISVGLNGIPKNPVTERDVTAIEDRMGELEENIDLPRSFLVPGSTPPAAALDLARSMARRLERLIVEAKEQQLFLNQHACVWVNRLSDYFFLLARVLEKQSGVNFNDVHD
jgi:cob(I)alamin adenosyltransferase